MTDRSRTMALIALVALVALVTVALWTEIILRWGLGGAAIFAGAGTFVLLAVWNGICVANRPDPPSEEEVYGDDLADDGDTGADREDEPDA